MGIRELRRNASQYIRLVKAGETIEVTERDVPVALLTPLPKGGEKKSRRDELIEQGLLVPATKDWRDFKPSPACPRREAALADPSGDARRGAMVATYYVDSSAIVKLAVPEAETNASRSALGAQRSQPASSEIALIEVRELWPGGREARLTRLTNCSPDSISSRSRAPSSKRRRVWVRRTPHPGRHPHRVRARAWPGLRWVITYDARMAEAARAAGIAASRRERKAR
ncbi:MAG: hypothetical protein IPN07_16995 [Dehalococcoidia bacterium]|nr:hypothetical protein [Dehalococcoidia bacterium]